MNWEGVAIHAINVILILGLVYLSTKFTIWLITTIDNVNNRLR